MLLTSSCAVVERLFSSSVPEERTWLFSGGGGGQLGGGELTQPSSEPDTQITILWYRYPRRVRIPRATLSCTVRPAWLEYTVPD